MGTNARLSLSERCEVEQMTREGASHRIRNRAVVILGSGPHVRKGLGRYRRIAIVLIIKQPGTRGECASDKSLCTICIASKITR